MTINARFSLLLAALLLAPGFPRLEAAGSTTPVQGVFTYGNGTLASPSNFFSANAALIPAGEGASLTTSVSAAGNTNLTATGLLNGDVLSVGAGSGAYAATICFPDAGVTGTSVFEVKVSMPASANPTITFYDNTTGGTLLSTMTGNGVAFTTTLQFQFNGTAWILNNKGALLQGQNLADLNSASIARGNLGLGSMATATAGTGLTLSSGSLSVNASQSISTLSNLTTNGLVTTSGGTGTLSVTPLGTGNGVATLTSGHLTTAQVPAFTGDVTNTAGSLAATVNSALGGDVKFQTFDEGAFDYYAGLYYDGIGGPSAGIYAANNTEPPTPTFTPSPGSIPALLFGLGANAYGYGTGYLYSGGSATKVIGPLNVANTWTGQQTLQNPIIEDSNATTALTVNTIASGTQPVIKIGATANTNWSSGGTMLGVVMPSGFSGNAIDLQSTTYNESIFKVDLGGNAAINGGIYLGGGGPIYLPSGVYLNFNYDTFVRRLTAGQIGVTGSSSATLGEVIGSAFVATQIPNPGTITATTSGTAGSTTITYGVSYLDAAGNKTGLSQVTITTANATLSGTNYVHLALPTVPSSASSQDVWRISTNGTSPTSTGLLANLATTTTTYNDTGVAVSGSAPSGNSTGGVRVGCTGLGASGPLGVGFNFLTGSTASQTATLPAPALYGGDQVVVKNQSSQSWTISSAAGIYATGAITTSSSVTLASGASATFWSDSFPYWNQL